MVLYPGNPSLLQLPCVCHGWLCKTSDLRVDRNDKEGAHSCISPSPHHLHIAKGVNFWEARDTEKVNSQTRLIAFNGKANTELPLSVSSVTQVTLLISAAREQGVL